MKQGVELSQKNDIEELEEEQQIVRQQKGLKILEIWAEGFFEDCYSTVKENIECFCVYDFKDKSLYHALEGFVCQELYHAESPSLGFSRHIENQNGEMLAVIDAEEHLRTLFEKTINDIIDFNLGQVKDKKQIPNTVLAGVVCKDMTKTACDSIFGLEKQKMKEDYQIKHLESHFINIKNKGRRTRKSYSNF